MVRPEKQLWSCATNMLGSPLPLGLPQGEGAHRKARLVRASENKRRNIEDATPDYATMRNPGYKDRHAPGVEASSGLGLPRNDTRRSGRRTPPRRQPGVILFRYRQDKRFANPASNSRWACRRALAAHLLRSIHPRLAGRGLLRIQLCALDAMGRISVQQLPKR